MKRWRPASRAAAAGGVSAAALAPMVDLLTILLVFLLKSYSTDPPVRPDDASFQLPTSSAEAEVRGPVRLDITGEAIFLEDERVAGVRYYLSSKDERIPELADALGEMGGGRVLLRAHEEVPYSVVRKALATARDAGVEQVQIVALSRSSL